MNISCSDGEIEVTEERGIVRLRLARPDKRNALTIEMAQKLTQKLDELAQDRSVHVLVLSGKGTGFCSGMDLLEAQDLQTAEEGAKAIADLMYQLYTFPKISIASVHGYAIAGGCALAAACDFVLAAKGTKFGYPEVRRGLVAAIALTFAARTVSNRRLRELFIFGELIEAVQAEEYGLISQVVPVEQLELETNSKARRALESAPGATAHLKRLIDEQQRNSLKADLQHALTIHKVMRTHREAQEGIAAFFEERKPSWYP